MSPSYTNISLHSTGIVNIGPIGPRSHGLPDVDHVLIRTALLACVCIASRADHDTKAEANDHVIRLLTSL